MTRCPRSSILSTVWQLSFTGYGHFGAFPKIVGFPPKSSILIGFSIINHPFWGTPIFGNTHFGHFGHFTFNTPWEISLYLMRQHRRSLQKISAVFRLYHSHSHSSEPATQGMSFCADKFHQYQHPWPQTHRSYSPFDVWSVAAPNLRVGAERRDRSPILGGLAVEISALMVQKSGELTSWNV